MVRSAIITGASAIGFAIGGWIVPMMYPALDPWVQKALLGFAAALLALAFFLWIGGLRAKSNDTAAINPTTAGHQSPNIVGSHNTVHISGAQVDSPITASPPPSAEDYGRYAKGLENVMRGLLKSRGPKP